MLKNGQTPYITGDGEQNRDFIYVGDLINLLILAADSEIYGEAFNAGSETNITINELYKTIARMRNSDIKPDYVEKVLEPRTTLADMTKAKKMLGWELKTTLEEGLERMIR